MVMKRQKKRISPFNLRVVGVEASGYCRAVETCQLLLRPRVVWKRTAMWYVKDYQVLCSESRRVT